MKAVILFGAAFNPVTFAHELIALTAHLKTGWPVHLMPCHDHKFGKVMASDAHRLAMTTLVVERNPEYMFLERYEIDNKASGSMWDTVSALSCIHPDTRYYLLIGKDNADNINKWHQWEALTEKYSFIVAGTDEEQPQQSEWFMQPQHLYMPCAVNCRSTLVRNHYESKSEPCTLVRSCVDNYVRTFGLYGAQK